MNKHYSILATVLGLAAAAAPGTATALVSWTFDTGNCQSTLGPSGNCGSGSNNFADSRVYDGAGGAGDVQVSGWGNTISGNTQLELGKITHYGGGLGVRNADGPRGQDSQEGSSPEHAVDNQERFDLVLFDFGSQLVELSQITLGWWQQDADISVLAYTGNLDPTDDQGADYIGDREAWWNSTAANDSNEDLTSNGWTLIGNYDVDSGPTNSDGDEFEDINAGDVASSYWLVSAYNPVFTRSCTPSNYCQSDYEDYFKILNLAGDIRVPVPPTSVPEPATALLLFAAVPFMRRRLLAKRD